MTDNWKVVVKGLKTNRRPDDRALVEKVILEAGGKPLRLLEARRRLFTLTMSAGRGLPAIIEAENCLVCLLSLDDLIAIVMDEPPTLYEIVHGGRDK